MTDDEIVREHHQFNGHKFEQTLGDSEGQGGLVCCSLWGYKGRKLLSEASVNVYCCLLSGVR